MKSFFGLVGLVLLAGCQKISNEKADYGPEVSKASINAALGEAMKGIDANSAKAGQAVAYLSTRRIGDSQTETTLGASTMAAVEDPEADGRLKLLIDTTARGEGGQMKTTRSERSVALGLVAAKAAAEPDPAGVTPAPRVTYHRLRTGTEPLTAPSALRARPNCHDLPDCKFEVRYVLFDVVAHTKNGAERVSITLGFSRQTPYLPYGDGFDRFNGALVVDCRASNVAVDGRSYAIHDCRRLIDFER